MQTLPIVNFVCIGHLYRHFFLKLNLVDKIGKMWPESICLSQYSIGTILKSAFILLMEEILHHLGCIKPCQEWDIYGYLSYQLVSRISEPSTVFHGT